VDLFHFVCGEFVEDAFHSISFGKFLLDLQLLLVLLLILLLVPELVLELLFLCFDPIFCLAPAGATELVVIPVVL
jgi:hypothetical protein